MAGIHDDNVTHIRAKNVAIRSAPMLLSMEI